MSEETENYSVVYATDVPHSDTVVLTMDELGEKWLSEAMNKYDPTNRQYSAYLSDKSSQESLTQETIDQLASNPQGDLKKINRINSIVKFYINKDDIIGKVADVIETNVNTEYRLSYKDFSTQRNKAKTLEKAKTLISNFNESISIESIIRNVIPTVYTEGNCIMCLRNDKDDYKIDFYPLGVVEVSNYSVGNNPVLLVNMEELKSRLSGNYPKTKKKRKALFFENMESEIKANYPKEVYQAYIDKEQYAKLDVKYSAIIRIGNMNGKYGLTPIFRTLSDVIMLDTFKDADKTTSKSRSKKIIVQLLNKEITGENYAKDRFDITSWSHANFVQAFKQKTVVVTAPPAVRDVKYVESKTELTDVSVVNEYRGKVLNSLGIGFLVEGSNSVSTANISVSQLMKTINKISEQLEEVLARYYKQILSDNGIDVSYAPKIKIIDSEQLEMDVKKELASLLYTTFNASLETSFGILGIDVADEAEKRKSEKEKGYDEVFAPRQTAYTNSGKKNNEEKVGNPRESTNPNKENYDKDYNKSR